MTYGDKLKQQERRERIAIAAMQGLLATGGRYSWHNIPKLAVEQADLLIEELDKDES